MNKKAIVLGGSRGLGKAISEKLKMLNCDVIVTSTQNLDTSDLNSVKFFANQQKSTDVLVLNTGRPTPKEFWDVTEDEWLKYHNQLFLGFCLLLKKIKINQGGFIFVISGAGIKEPPSNLIISNAYRLAFTSVLKTLSKDFAKNQISCINLACGPIHTESVNEIIQDIDSFQKTIPMQRLGKPEELANFIKAIIEYDIKYLSGVVINFDGANSNHIF